MTKRGFPRSVVPVTAAFVTLALVWPAVAVPALVKYPTDLDVTPRYQGVFTLFVDPTTAAPLDAPRQAPLEIERHVRSLGHESGASRVVVEERIRQRAADLVDTTQTNAYVMDRRSMRNVADQRAYAFDPSNVVDRSGTYRLNLPFDASPDATYRIYQNETATAYAMRADATAPTADEAGLRLHNFIGSATEVPLDDAYLAEIDKVVALPESMTLDQLKPRLAVAGLDVDAVLAALAPVITPDDLATFVQIAAQPIPLRYVLSFEGRAAIETTTGAEVDVGAVEWVGAKPVLADVATLQALVAHYPNVPEAVTADHALAALSSAPATKLFEYRYRQTRASVADIAAEVKALRNQIRLVETFVPFGLWGAAGLSVVVGALVYRHRLRPANDVHAAVPALEPAPERAPVSSGAPR
jgi:hypothetical protein